MSVDRVVIIVDVSEAEGTGDCAAYLSQSALAELRMGRGYNDTELAEVERDETFKRSCRETGIKLHDRETGRKEAVLKGRDGVPERLTVRVPIRFTRPVSRGMFNRQVGSMRE